MFFTNKDKEGPELVTIPATTYYSCRYCKFYEHGMIKSGMHPLFRDNCSHEKAPVSAGMVFGVGNLMEDNTPDWCPFKQLTSNIS